MPGLCCHETEADEDVTTSVRDTQSREQLIEVIEDQAKYFVLMLCIRAQSNNALKPRIILAFVLMSNAFECRLRES